MQFKMLIRMRCGALLPILSLVGPRCANQFKCSFRFVFTSLLLALSSSAWPQYSEPYQLNGELAAGGDVGGDYQISADSSRVVYRADEDVDEVYELFSVPIEGGNSVQINGLMVGHGDVHNFQISPDSNRVVYTAGMFTASVSELFSVSIMGSTKITRLNDLLVFNGNVTNFQISADSNRVVYRADKDADEVFELFSVPITGGSSVRLNATLGSDEDVESFEISPDGSRVIYRAGEGSPGGVGEVFEIFSVPIAGGTTPVQLNGWLIPGGSVQSFKISSDSSRVVYRADEDWDGIYELYSVPIGGGISVKLNGPLTGYKDVDDFEISPDSKRVVYVADENTHNVNEVFSVPITGGATAVSLNGSVDNSHFITSEFKISADSRHVVYRADQFIAGVNELYSVPIGGGIAVKLNDSMPGFGDIIAGAYEISANSYRVVYKADKNTDNVYELFSVPIAGGTNVRLNDLLVDSGDVGYFRITPDSDNVVFQADADENNVNELFIVPITGGKDVKLNKVLPYLGNVGGYRISPDSGYVVYSGDQDVNEENELFGVKLPDRGMCFPVKAKTSIAVICL